MALKKAIACIVKVNGISGSQIHSPTWNIIALHVETTLKYRTKAKFRRRTSHEPNRMQMRKILCSPSLAFDSAHVKYGV